MPQFYLPGSPVAQGIEAGLAIAAVQVFGYSQTALSSGAILGAVVAVALVNWNVHALSTDYDNAFISPAKLAMEAAVVTGLVELYSGAISPIDICIVAAIIYVYNDYIQKYIAPTVDKVVNKIDSEAVTVGQEVDNVLF